MTDTWNENGIYTDKEYAILTNEIYKEWLGFTAKEYSFEENKKIAKLGGHAAKSTKADLEKNPGETIISSNNNLNYQYIDEKEKIEINN